MASGFPVIASDIAAHHEICGQAVMYLSRFSAEELALRIVQVARSDSLRRQLADRGSARSQYFSWENTSVKLLISPESWQIFRQPTSHCLAWQSDDRMLFECFHSTANDGQRLDSEQPLLARGSNVEAISNPAEWRESATELAHKV